MLPAIERKTTACVMLAGVALCRGYQLRDYIHSPTRANMNRPLPFLIDL
jgi:hypothetical protein